MIQTESITNFRTNYKEVLKRTIVAPVLLLQNSALAGVLVSPEEWNRLNTELSRLRRMIKADRALVEMKAGNYIDITDEAATWKEAV